MAESLFLTRSRAKYDYTCGGCKAPISRRTEYYRHDPHPYARIFRGQQTSQWCVACNDKAPTIVNPVGKLVVGIDMVVDLTRRPSVQVELLNVSPLLLKQLAADPERVNVSETAGRQIYYGIGCSSAEVDRADVVTRAELMAGSPSGRARLRTSSRTSSRPWSLVAGWN